ncbi:MAG TPA: DUF58 domain-containing protein [Parvularculaceae bacterium]|nr:DUF58 domain-containing protein [Caulobacterales bacterium]HPE31833.1 DUF58 domain-containing protein [Parvularculaceae bacterium]HRX37941.1 DUF58 domain-containing protein [Parvularculaceae bacterium]
MSPSAHLPAGALQTRHEAEEAAALFPALMVEADRVAHTVAAGLHGRRRAGPGETFWQHRAYGFGDPVSAIDWRQSARAADRLYVRQNEWEAAAAVWIWRDASASLVYSSSTATPMKRRRADVLATALSILLSQAGERVGLMGLSQRPFHGRGAPTRILEALLTDDAGASAPTPVQLTPGARVVFLSDFFTSPDEIAAAIRRCASAGALGALVQIVDPAEEEFPFTGRTEFQDAESRDRLLFGDAGALGASYREKFMAHRRALEDAASAYRWTFIAHRTDRPAQGALLALYAALSDLRMLKG